MKTLCVEGWRGINHSYAIVNQWQLLELTKLPLHLWHRDVPYYRPDWNAADNASGFTPEEAQIIAQIPAPLPATPVDATYRISYPYNLEAIAGQLFVFGTSETQQLTSRFFQGDPVFAARNPDLAIVTPSAWSKAGFLQAGFAPDRVHVIPHGINPRTFAPVDSETRDRFRAALNVQPEDFVLLSLGAMTGNKGIDLLLIAFALLKQNYPQLKLVLKDQSNLYGITGQSHLEALQASPCAELLTPDVVESVIFVSENLPLTHLRALYGAADCYVSPYRAEGFNLPPLEAAACGVPIVVTQGGATDDYFHPCLGRQIASQVVQADAGVMLEPDIDALIEAIATILEHPGQFGGTSGSEYVHQQFSWANVTAKLVQVLMGE